MFISSSAILLKKRHLIAYPSFLYIKYKQLLRDDNWNARDDEKKKTKHNFNEEQ